MTSVRGIVIASCVETLPEVHAPSTRHWYHILRYLYSLFTVISVQSPQVNRQLVAVKLVKDYQNSIRSIIDVCQDTADQLSPLLAIGHFS